MQGIVLVMEGRVDLGWIGGLVDDALADQRSAFDAAWVDPPSFDAWVSEDAEAVPERSFPELLDSLKLMYEIKPGQQPLVDQITGSLGNDDG